jgi:hypothetical protein
MTDYLKEEMRRTAAAKSPDKKTARLALHFCQQAFQITDARIVDDRYIIAANLDFDFTDELAVIGVINQMCDAYGLSMDIAIRNPNGKKDWLVTICKANDSTLTKRPYASSPILRRAIFHAAIYAHATYVAPAFREAARAAAQPTPPTERMLLPQFEIPGCSVMVQYPADQFTMVKSKIDGFLKQIDQENDAAAGKDQDND